MALARTAASTSAVPRRSERSTSARSPRRAARAAGPRRRAAARRASGRPAGPACTRSVTSNGTSASAHADEREQPAAPRAAPAGRRRSCPPAVQPSATQSRAEQGARRGVDHGASSSGRTGTVGRRGRARTIAPCSVAGRVRQPAGVVEVEPLVGAPVPGVGHEGPGAHQVRREDQARGRHRERGGDEHCQARPPRRSHPAIVARPWARGQSRELPARSRRACAAAPRALRGVSMSARQSGPPGTWTTHSGCSASTARAPGLRARGRRAGQAARAKPAGWPRRRPTWLGTATTAPPASASSTASTVSGSTSGLSTGWSRMASAPSASAASRPGPDRASACLRPSAGVHDDQERSRGPAPARPRHACGLAPSTTSTRRDARRGEARRRTAPANVPPAQRRERLRAAHAPALAGRQHDRRDAHAPIEPCPGGPWILGLVDALSKRPYDARGLTKGRRDRPDPSSWARPAATSTTSTWCSGTTRRSRSWPSPPPRSRTSTAGATRRSWPGRAIPTGIPIHPESELARLIRERRRRPGRLRLQRRLPRDRDAPRPRWCWPPAPTSGCSGPRPRMLAVARAGGLGVRRAHRQRQEPDDAPRGRDPARQGPARGRRPPPDALRRPGRASACSASPPSRTSSATTARSRSARSTSRTSPTGGVVYAGVDYAAILAEAEKEADVIVWDGGNNDLPFYAPDLEIVVADPHRPGHERHLPSGRDQPAPRARGRDQQDRHRRTRRAWPRVRELDPRRSTRGAIVVDAASPHVRRATRTRSAASACWSIEDGPTLTHGEMKYGAGVVAARKLRRGRDRRPAAVRRGLASPRPSRSYPGIGTLLPAMGYGERADRATWRRRSRARRATWCWWRRRSTCGACCASTKPAQRVGYELQEIGQPDLADALRSF